MKFRSNEGVALVATMLACYLHIVEMSFACSALVVGLVGLAIFTGMRPWPQRAMSVACCVWLAVALIIAPSIKSFGLVLLVLVACQKLFDLRSARDIAVLLGLDLFLIGCAVPIWDMDEGRAIIFFCAFVVVVAFIGCEPMRIVPSLRRRLSIAITATLCALPAAALVLAVLPGSPTNGSQLRAGLDRKGGMTGMSDRMTPGQVASISESSEVAFTARFFGPIPDDSQLYWRAEVLNDFDGRSWYNEKSAPTDSVWPRTGAPTTEKLGRPMSYEIRMSASGQKWLPTLSAANSVASDNPALRPAIDDQLVARTAVSIDTPSAFKVTTYARYFLARDTLSEEDKKRMLALPPGVSPRALALGEKLRLESSGRPGQIVGNAYQFFLLNHFRYTKSPGLMSRDAVDQFLFEQRAGFCEHYAGAFVFLMRAAGVPARVVLGYHGGEPGTGPDSARVTVYQADAHAWAEVWLPGRGWMRLDPTEVSRAEPAASSSLLAGLFQGAPSAIVTNFKSIAESGPMALAAVGSFVGVVGGAYLWRSTRRRRKMDPTLQLFDKFEKVMSARGAAREINEGPISYSVRLGQILPADDAAAARKFLALYARLQYGRFEGEAKEAQRQLRMHLRRCAPWRRWYGRLF